VAKEKGLDVIFNRCMMAEHMRLFKWIKSGSITSYITLSSLWIPPYLHDLFLKYTEVQVVMSILGIQ
jgi:hypothetical protein